MKPWRVCLFLLLHSHLTATARGGVGDPQIRTDRPWYPGEMACSTFERLFVTQGGCLSARHRRGAHV
jgi:hypothetical protein